MSKYTIISLLSLLLALFLLWLGWIGPVPPSPQVIVVVNDEKEFHTIKQTSEQPIMIPAEEGKKVKVKVEIYYRDKLINPGEFTYQWCFTPPVDDNRYCTDGNNRMETNSDYKPENSVEQELKITVNHDFFKTSTIYILFKPE